MSETKNHTEEYAIEVNHVTKKFRIYIDKGSTLKERVLFKKRNTYEDRWVLKDISFKVRKGEAIGLIGHNGCGKSTTLKLLTRIMYPDSGSITMRGRVSSLIELGAGFHPDMSGRENIYTNASIFGLTRREIEKRIADIIEFSELGSYIDNPVRTYSSGMYMRLAFAVAINVDADILLIDEILAVGDAAFQAKCFNKLREIKRNGTTIVIVSHSLGQIEQICERSFWIDEGLIREEGRPHDVHQKYMAYMSNRSGTLSGDEAETREIPEEHLQDETGEQIAAPDPSEGENETTAQEELKRWGSRDIELTKIALLNEKNEETDRFECGQSMKIVFHYHMNQLVEELAFGIGIFRNDGLQCYGTNTDIDNLHIQRVSHKDGCVVCNIAANTLLPGEYLLDAAIHKPDGFAFDYWRECAAFTVWSVVSDVGVTRLAHEWTIN